MVLIPWGLAQAIQNFRYFLWPQVMSCDTIKGKPEDLVIADLISKGSINILLISTWTISIYRRKSHGQTKEHFADDAVLSLQMMSFSPSEKFLFSSCVWRLAHTQKHHHHIKISQVVLIKQTHTA